MPESVEKAIFNTEAGFGIWINYETRLSSEFTLRSEVGLNANFFLSYNTNNDVQFMAGPSLNIEPRWYYNLKEQV